MNTRSRAASALALALPLGLLAACGTESEPATETTPEATEAATEEAAPTEVHSRTARVAVTYDGGIKVLDAQTLEEVGDVELEGFNRLNPAGDGQHLSVSTTGGFQLLDLGTWGEGHGDHFHYYTADPALTDVAYDAEKPGHVVLHDGETAFFDDGTGHVQLVDSLDVAAADAEIETVELPDAHHGVAVPLSDGTLLVTVGTEDERTGVAVLDADGEQVAAYDDCPGVHGEAVAQGEAVVVGCENGAVVYSGGEFTAVETPDDYSRIGNQAGTEGSPIVLGDYKTDPDAELERPTRVSLIDTRDASHQLVDLPASYSFRSIARGDDGEALVLTTDGDLQVIDPESGEITASIPVVDEWEEPTEWQQPRPAVLTLDGSVYVTDPANQQIHAVDLVEQEVWASADLGVEANEISGVHGEPSVSSEEAEEHEHSDEEHAEDEHSDEDHEDHDH
ncbi:zinc metallochaperone AztD [Isoptericola chiayiensis]|uniref:Zinc metallochaperone AztD n=1 Tax=Isoptericola chiayiensis TaxID=579446 RepID=A0ABP8YR02_9MICO|nr:zinc metallochaperone AztD [Isoptericola chiayiensis]NOW02265.1 DNA-binding beta-propeller fold protein YncE [Isoptericola chiayiensis]